MEGEGAASVSDRLASCLLIYFPHRLQRSWARGGGEHNPRWCSPARKRRPPNAFAWPRLRWVTQQEGRSASTRPAAVARILPWHHFNPEQGNLGPSQPQVSFLQAGESATALELLGFTGKLRFLGFAHLLNSGVSPRLLPWPHSHHEGRRRSCSLSIQMQIALVWGCFGFFFLCGFGGGVVVGCFQSRRLQHTLPLHIPCKRCRAWPLKATLSVFRRPRTAGRLRLHEADTLHGLQRSATAPGVPSPTPFRS